MPLVHTTNTSKEKLDFLYEKIHKRNKQKTAYVRLTQESSKLTSPSPKPSGLLTETV